MSDLVEVDQPTTAKDWVAAIVITESAALLIAAATVFLPGRSGANWSPADALFDDPGHLVRLLGAFVLVNVMLMAIAGIVWLLVRLEVVKSDRSPREPEAGEPDSSEPGR